MASKQKAKKVKPKTNKAALKRFKKTANGYKFRKGNRAHIKTKKSPKLVRQARHDGMVKACDENNIKNMLATQA